MQIGDKVMVPRTGGGNTPGEVIEVYENHARVKFQIGDYYRYKTLRQTELKEVKI